MQEPCKRYKIKQMFLALTGGFLVQSTRPVCCGVFLKKKKKTTTKKIIG
jgi:hypothetical protein